MDVSKSSSGAHTKPKTLKYDALNLAWRCAPSNEVAPLQCSLDLYAMLYCDGGLHMIHLIFSFPRQCRASLQPNCEIGYLRIKHVV